MSAYEEEEITYSMGRFISERAAEFIANGVPLRQAVVHAQFNAFAICVDAFVIYSLASVDHEKESDETVARMLTGDMLRLIQSCARNMATLRKHATELREKMLHQAAKGSA